jgi:hypothetical protein
LAKNPCISYYGAPALEYFSGLHLKIEPQPALQDETGARKYHHPVFISNPE